MLQESKNNKNVFGQIFKMFDKKDRIRAIFALLFIGISAISDLANPFVLRLVIDNINFDENTGLIDPNQIQWYWYGVMAALAIASIVSQSLSVVFSMFNATKTTYKIRNKLFIHTRYLSAQDVNRIGSSSILTRITADVTQLEQFLINYNTFTVKALFLMLGGFGLSIYQLATFDGSSVVWYAAFAYLFIVLFVVVAGLMIKKAMPNFSKSREAIDTNNVSMQENIIGNKLIRMLNLQSNQRRRYNKGNKNLRDILIKSEKIIAVLVPISFFFLNLAIITIFVVGGIFAWFAPKGPESLAIVGVIISFTQYLMMILIGVVLFSSFGYIISRAKVSGKRIIDILNIESSIKESENPVNITTGDIEFKNVSFSYDSPDDKKTTNASTIQNINLKINAGSSVGIIGQTGSGKSTIVKLLTRLYDVKEGQILISGNNIKDISFSSLHKEISVSLQEKVLLKGTFKSNILIGNPDASDDEVIEAAKSAEAWEFISKKEDKLDGVVEERGSNLSGGQKQRVSIARALIKNPKILIIDDSTSALDTITERKILNNLKNKFNNVTKIIISQKVKSIQECDNIIVLEQGRIKQQGTHEELLKNKDGVYAKLYESQKTSLED